MIKKIVSAVLIAVLTIGVSACGAQPTGNGCGNNQEDDD